MDKDSIQEFINTNVQDERANATFEKENSYMLEVKLDGKIWAKIAYTGAVRFTREGMLEHGVGKFLKKVVTGVGARLMKMEGNGRVYLADRGKKVQILNLQEETIFVNGNDLLAFQDQVEWDITMMRRISGMMTGGLFNIRLSGSGMVAITTHYDPLTLRVSPGQSVFTDPNATVAWSGSLSPDIHTDVTFRTFLGRGSGESIHLKFEGDGWVVLQPFEEVYFQKS